MDSDEELDIVEQAERTALEENVAESENIDGVEEVQREVNEDEVEEVQADGENENDEENRQIIKPKRVVRNPQPKLNADTLRGPRGLTALPAVFAKQKFKGKGHEEADLNVMLKGYEYWCHRLFPKMRFDQCIAKIEHLGNKKQVMTYIKRIRMGILDDNPPEPQENQIVDEIDENVMLQQQQQQQIESVEARFDAVFNRPNETQEIKQNRLTEEQMETIRMNKERAMKLRAERLRRIQEKAEGKLEVSSVLPSQEETFTNNEEQCRNNENTEESINLSTIEKEFHDKSINIISNIIVTSSKTQENKINDSQNGKKLDDDTEVDLDDFLNNLQDTDDSTQKQVKQVELKGEGYNKYDNIDENDLVAHHEEEEMDVDQMLCDLDEHMT